MRRDRFISTKNSSSGLDHFVKNNFSGSKREWISFNDEVITAVRAKCGEEGKRYLTTNWPNDECDDPLFVTLPILPTLEGVLQIQMEDPQNPGVLVNVQVTAEMRKERRESNRDRRDHNESVNKMKTEIFQIIASRVNAELNVQLQSQNGDPLQCYLYLDFHFGTHSLGPQDKGDSVISLITTEMKTHEKFQNFMINFRDKWR